jgi:uncharacterized protein (TIGR03067 family)
MFARALFAALTLLLPTVGRAEDKPQSDAKAILGEWLITRIQEGGNWKMDVEPMGTPVAIAEEKITVRDPNNSWDVRYKLDSSAKPKVIEVTLTVGEFAGKTAKGIYKLDGDALTICYGVPGGPVPTEFATAKGTNQIMFLLKRAK